MFKVNDPITLTQTDENPEETGVITEISVDQNMNKVYIIRADYPYEKGDDCIRLAYDGEFIYNHGNTQQDFWWLKRVAKR